MVESLHKELTQSRDRRTKMNLKNLNNSTFGKTIGNVRNHRDIKLVTTNKKRNKMVSEPNFHSTKHFSEELLKIKTKTKEKKCKSSIFWNTEDKTKQIKNSLVTNFLSEEIENGRRMTGHMGIMDVVQISKETVFYLKLINIINLLCSLWREV